MLFQETLATCEAYDSPVGSQVEGLAQGFLRLLGLSGEPQGSTIARFLI